MRHIRAALVALSALTAGAAYAEGPGGGPRLLSLNYTASDTCQKVLSTRRGAPPGQSVGSDTIPVTVTIGPNPRGCGDSRRVTGRLNIGGPQSLIKVFYVDTSGRILKTERIAMK